MTRARVGYWALLAFAVAVALATTGAFGYVVVAFPPLVVGLGVGYIYESKRRGAFAFLIVALFLIIGAYYASRHSGDPGTGMVPGGFR